ncbi:hypothetical protein KFU94_57100 [Chloroflexi bacterium TSY]|nr:hypothetical protein [Chloroflexi bacterium TSY]
MTGITVSFQGGFTTVYIMTDGGPANYSMVTMLYFYRKVFNYMHIECASVFAWILFAVIVIFTVIQFRLADHWVFNEMGTK